MLSRTVLGTATRGSVAFVPRATIRPSGCRFLSIHSELSKKEKVEEDRYIRQKEHEAYLARKEALAKEKAVAEMTAAEEAAKSEMDATISEVFGVLSVTGEKLSDAAVENFAAWKLGK